jgi:type VI secretion system protein ImpI
VAVNDARSPLTPLEPRALKSGDRIYIDEYEIAVAITDSAQTRSSTEQALSRAAVPRRESALDPLLSTNETDLDPLEKLLSRSAVSLTGPTHDPAWNHSSSLQDHFNPPLVRQPAVTPATSPGTVVTAELSPAGHIPAGWEEATAVSRPPPTQPPSAALPSQTQAPPAFDVGAFLRGAGLEPDAVPPEMAATLGQIFHSVVQGMIEVLHARAEFRNQFRMALTRVQAVQNNPLKFALNAEDALAAMLRPRARGYMQPLEAFEDAFDDIRFHQLATLAGMRAGFESMMRRFDPKRLQQLAVRRNPGVLARLFAKSRNWDGYVEQFEEMAGNADAVFHRMYGEEFSGAYERQLEELKRNRVKPSR